MDIFHQLAMMLLKQFAHIIDDDHESGSVGSRPHAGRGTTRSRWATSSPNFGGEAVMYDDFGRSDFNLLQASLGGRGGKASSDAVFMAFDLLYLDGHAARTPASPR